MAWGTIWFVDFNGAFSDASMNKKFSRRFEGTSAKISNILMSNHRYITNH